MENHDSGLGNLRFAQGPLIGLAPSLILAVVSLLLWRKLRTQRKTVPIFATPD
jgi:hypothetical protein